MVPLAVLPLLILTLLGVRSTSDALTANVEQNARTSATTLQQQLEQGTNRVAQDALLGANLAETAVFGTQPTSRAAFLNTLNSVWGYAAIEAYDPDGRLGRGYRGAPRGQRAHGPRLVPDRAAPVQRPGVLLRLRDRAGQRPAAFQVSTPVYRSDGRLLGVLRMEWMPTNLVAQARAVAGPNRQVDLLSRGGARFASTQANRVSASARRQATLPVEPRAGGRHGRSTTRLGLGARRLRAGHPSRVRARAGLDGRGRRDLDQALAPVTQQRALAFLLLAVLLALVLLVAIAPQPTAAHRPVDALAQVARRVQEGDLAARARCTAPTSWAAWQAASTPCSTRSPRWSKRAKSVTGPAPSATPCSARSPSSSTRCRTSPRVT